MMRRETRNEYIKEHIEKLQLKLYKEYELNGYTEKVFRMSEELEKYFSWE